MTVSKGVSARFEEMREIIAELIEWQARMGDFDSAPWIRAKALMTKIRDDEDCERALTAHSHR